MDQILKDIEQKSLEILLTNRRQTDGFQYTIPSPQTYPYQWLWDSCFHAIILSYFNPEDAKKEILALVSKQFENGMIPHMIYWQKGDVINLNWGKDGTSSITQPPMLAYAVWEIFKKDHDKKFLEVMYPHLYHFYNYLLTDRDPRKNYLIGIINPDESGEDNSPRFDIPLGLPPQHTLDENTKRRYKLIDENLTCNFDAPFCMKNFFWVKDVPFNAIFVENLRVLVLIADQLGLKDDALNFQQQQLEVTKAMREKMFEDGLFWSTYGEDYKKIKVVTWAIFIPLFAKILSQEEAVDLVNNHLLNPDEFWCEFPIPTVALNEPSFDPEGFWRGPTWIAVNWFIFKGLLNYGLTEPAEKIMRTSIELITQSGFREQFNPLNGKGSGAYDFTWGALVIDMIKSFETPIGEKSLI
ncbi:MAG: hypothetical protein A3J07_03850 [Candidatus Doudnabacteria bacterium RIFCSPLOWO2_02_FULL_49_13]|uniref:Mannosylglycerate hydrolase MGH1-like glycoside hydrolase domain-containing protein n=1 Tax=Candidatus Doudnabacteria bacterium RIFCSPHIGHO2_12_FULL_48_16 TaxID=1817838 RepID=A0A1F5PK29_9BACT|nr:MAG: hypothetical protein A3B77_02660 [Candidatus Doudnabacteria bacterium RIFCSPHIGHO2_02_FULL_49_24]OGE89607.1 MAG: hypothetical protein A2760_03865 [Candidatus Doudnabacteria bacterium RIFCSPHIGHO2_01_FULL_50_67]OGE90050.1 MAG: hypothetical protein A3E29_02995 [Candidatus Doudnabacteria bacterium RIFCSPHIGHO2_12_FULL_48_16]OGE96623.1 MAG: hypothetical protein A2990_00305 [Candidatus Doudnabacteria bacterium RIFCSPLOWO2_01_FULL_49_40]OGF03193.1 MAG: hypothetical protein A3J07_03850 [Candid